MENATNKWKENVDLMAHQNNYGNKVYAMISNARESAESAKQH